MINTQRLVLPGGLRVLAGLRSQHGLFVMAALITVFGFWVIYPITLVVVNSFNDAEFAQPFHWSLANWRASYSQPGTLKSLTNTFLVFGLYVGIGFPVAVTIAWALARTKMPFSRTLELMFWVSFMLPTISTTVGWTFLLDPFTGMLNYALVKFVPFIDTAPFNIYSLAGIVFAHLMSSEISTPVMLLTPAFRNMDAALEEAGRVSGASNLRTMLRVTLPLMIPPITIVFMLKLARIMQSFEIEQILGTSIGFFIYSTRIFALLTNFEPPLYGQAAALGTLTLLVIAFIIPLQRWLLSRRRYTTVTGNYRPGLIDLGRMQPVAFGLIAFLVAMLTVIPLVALIGGSFMTRVGFFEVNQVFTLVHWRNVFLSPDIMRAVVTTFLLASSTAVISPIMFSGVAYVLVRTRWPAKGALDSIFWLSSGVPGILAGLGFLTMFLQTPFLSVLYGTIYAMMLVVILQGKLLSTQITKSVFLQLGADLEEAARVSGAGWVYTYFRIWLPLLLPTLVTMGVINFVLAANTTSTLILLADRETTTLSILTLALVSGDHKLLEQAGILSLFIIGMTLGVALIARKFGFKVGLGRTQ